MTVLEADSVGTFGTDLFTSTSAAPPKFLPSGSLTIIETGGSGHDRTQNAIIRPAMVRPGAQLVARGKTAEIARVKAHLAYDTVVQVRNQWINSGWYLEIRPLQEPFDGGKDGATGEAKSIFNVLARVGQRPW